jgi:Tfp pilus assembly protein PilO
MMNMNAEINVGGQSIPAIYVAIALPVIALLYVGYAGFMAGDDAIMTKNDAITAQEADVDKKRGDAEELKRKAKEIDKINEEKDELQKSITLLKQQIPAEAQVPVLLFDIERMAKASQGTLNSFEPGNLRAFSAGGDTGAPGAAAKPAGGAATDDIQELPVTIKATATYPEVIKFIDQLSAYERKLNISNLALTPAAQAGVISSQNGNTAPVFKNTLNVEFTLLAYVLKDNAPQAASGAPQAGKQ